MYVLSSSSMIAGMCVCVCYVVRPYRHLGAHVGPLWQAREGGEGEHFGAHLVRVWREDTGWQATRDTRGGW